MVSFAVLFEPPLWSNGVISKTEAGLYSDIKGFPSPVTGPAPTLAADEGCWCLPSRPARS